MTNNPYVNIWFNTNETIEKILKNEIRFNYHIPVLLTVIGGSVASAKDIYFVVEDMFLTVIVSIIFIFLAYLALLRLFPWLIKKTGGIWNGKSDINELRIVIGLAQIPALILLAEQIIFLGFGQLVPEMETNIILQWLVWIFYMRILILGTAKVQGFSIMVTFLNLVISVLPLFLLRMIFI
ncbi:hypothetical protein [Fulvivirga sp.]|jgi:hypothetical protein|uniref:hypothetical protein n=1 Tax=Fulvivirga sp. TaxID=1931237 RepID=UPI0032EF202D